MISALTLNRLFEAIPPMLAFRTTNKAGAVLMLGAALALGAAAPRWLAAARRLLKPDGAIWVLTDGGGGQLIKLTPKG